MKPHWRTHLVVAGILAALLPLVAFLDYSDPGPKGGNFIALDLTGVATAAYAIALAIDLLVSSAWVAWTKPSRVGVVGVHAAVLCAIVVIAVRLVIH